MAITPFVFKSENLPRIKAKQLNKAFPFLKLAAAQEATARALGYSSWFECTRRGTQGEPSLSDQAAGMPVRVGRYYHQAGTLMSIGITPSEADIWVRGWGLTGEPSLAPERSLSQFYLWKNAIEEVERGEITEEQLMEQFDVDNSKYPEITHPMWVCPGVIIGPTSFKYPRYALDPALQAKIPMYLRGPAGNYHCQDDTDVLTLCIPGFPEVQVYRDLARDRLSWVQHEWHFGEKHPHSNEPWLPGMISRALAQPDDMVVLSQRAMPDGPSDFDFSRCAVACLRGRDFAAFLLSKGVVDHTKVVWYQNLDTRQFQGACHAVQDSLFWNGQPNLTVFVDAHKHSPSLPLYSYPFKTAPMHVDEFSDYMEHACLLPLNQDYPDDNGDGDDGGDDGLPYPNWDDSGPSSAIPKMREPELT